MSEFDFDVVSDLSDLGPRRKPAQAEETPAKAPAEVAPEAARPA